jgi:hypothetical protein
MGRTTIDVRGARATHDGSLPGLLDRLAGTG